MTIQEELALAAELKSGNREAFGALWDALTPKLYGYLVHTTQDKSLADDMLQATWLKALERIHTFEPRGVAFHAWLFAIARNECKQYWRKTRYVTSADITHHEGVAAESMSGTETALQNAMLAEQVLARLSEDDRELLRLRYIADMSVKDIAQAMKLSSVVVRVRMHRALARARLILKSYDYEEAK